jgi:hypothetical protein
MSGNFEFELPDGRVILVEGAPSAEAAKEFMDAQWPTLRRQTPIRGFGGSANEQFWSQLAGLPGAAEAVAAAVNAPEARDYLRSVSEGINVPNDPRTRPPELSDLVSSRAVAAVKAYAGQAAGSIAGMVPGAVAGAGAGFLVGGPAGAAAGARIAAGGQAALSGVSELYRGLVDEGVDPTVAGRIAIPVGAAISRIENRYVEQALARSLGGQVSQDAIGRLAQRVVGGRAGGIRQTAVGGAASEMAGEALRETTRGVVTGEANLPERLSRVAEAGIVGTLGGAGVGAATRMAGGAPPSIPEGQQATPAQPTVEQEPAPTTEAAPAPEAVAPEVAPAPAPASTPEAVAPTPTPTPATAVQPEVTQAPVTEAAAPAPEAPPQTTREAAPATGETAGPGIIANRHIGNVITEMTADGFTTAKGSTYQINEQGQTIRTKLSPGRGQGTTYEPHNALYVTPQDSLDLLTDMQGGGKYRFVVNTPNGPQVLGPDEVIGDRQAAIAVFNPSGSFDRFINAEKTPAVGLAPVELRYDTGQTEAAPAPAPEAAAPAPAPQITPEQEQGLWRGYSLNAGPEAQSPIVQAARDVASQRQRPFTRPEFAEFANAVASAPTPDAQQAVLQNYSALRQAPTADQVTPAEAVGAPRGTPQMTEPERQQIKEQIDEPIIGSVLNFFASPILTLTRLSRAFAPVRTAFMKFTALDNFYKTAAAASHKSLNSLSDASKQKVILGLDRARRERKEINQADYTAEELNAIRDFRSHMNFIYNNAIEAVARKYFDPALATDPAQRTKLQALQDKHMGKFLTEIPAAELNAVSPEGSALVEKYKAARDPFFFPQRTSGSHFVAAYERLPNGKKKLVALYGYNPLRPWQRARGFENPETTAIRKLREEFPDANTHYVMTSGVKFKNDEQAFNLKRDGDFINKYLDSLRDVSGKEGREIIDRMSAEIKKANIDSLFKPYNGILRAVTPENAVEYASNYLPAYYLTAGRLNARLYSQEDFDQAFKPLRPENRELFEGVLANGTAPVEAYGTAQTFVFFQYLGFALDTAAVSGLQIPTSVAPRLGRDGGVARGSKYLTEALADSLFDKAIFSVLKSDQAYAKAIADKQIRKDEADALRRAIQRGVFVPTSAFRMQGSVSAADVRAAGIADKDAVKFANGVNTVVDLAGRPLAAIEEFGRSSTFMAAYRMARDNPSVIEQANRYDNTNYKNAEDYAAGVVFDTWYTGSRLDDPGFLRQFPILNLATQFMRPVFKFTETVLRDATKTLKAMAARDLTMARIGAISVFGSLAPLVLLGGIWALPFADLSRELLERMLKTFFDNPLDLRLELDRAMGGGYLGEAANYGLPSASNIANLSKRIAVDPVPSDTLFSWSTLALFGPGGDLLQRIPKTYEHWKRGEYWEAAASFPFTPRVAGNAIKGTQLAVAEEQFTQAGTRFITPELLERVDSRLAVPSSVRQALGFPAPELANERELYRRQKVIDDATDEATKSINMELSRFYLRAIEAQRNGNMDEAYRQVAALQKRYVEFIAEQQSKPLHLRVIPNIDSARERARQDLFGRSSNQILLEETRRQARPALLPILEEMRWRDRPGFAEGGEVRGEERFPVRQPYESELEFFEKNPNVTGMAAEDGKVILNPYSDLSEQEREAVVLNERARLAIREGLVPPPNFVLTPEQMAVFSRINNGRPYGNPQVIKETLAARILSGDPSAQKPTRAQLEYVEELRQALSAP